MELRRFFQKWNGRDHRPAGPSGMDEALPTSRYTFGEWLNRQGLIGSGVEVGSFNGWFAADLLHQWRGEKLYLIDPWRFLEYWDDPMNAHKEEQGCRLLNTFQSVYRFGRRAAIIRELSEDAARLFADHSLDFVYIDADHTYTGVQNDIELWYGKVKKGGVLAGHDYQDGLAGNGAVYGVKSAVDDWARNEGRSIGVIEERPGHEASWLIRL